MRALTAGRRAGTRSGFTLTEVVVSAAVMMIVFLAGFGMISFARRSSSIAENRLAAMHIARSFMESLVCQSYTATGLTVGTKQLPGNRGTYVVAEDADGKTKNITVTINWIEPTGLQQSVSVTTSLSKSLHK
jgi:type II secretory pathway pseudopilin PulG